MRLLREVQTVRQATDTAPDWQCPALSGGIRAMFHCRGGARNCFRVRRPGAPESSLRFVTLWGCLHPLLVVAFAGYGMVRNAQQRKLSSTRIEAPGTSSSAEGREAQPGRAVRHQLVRLLQGHAREFLPRTAFATEYDIESSDSARRARPVGGRGIPLIVVGEEVLRGC